MRRRPNKFGSVTKLSGNRRRPWIAKAFQGWDEEGRPKYNIIGYYEREREATIELNRYINRPTSSKMNITLQNLYNEWRPAKYRTISKQQQGVYNAAWKKIEHLGNEKFRELRTAQFQCVIDELYEPTDKEKKPASRSTLEKVKQIVCQLYKYAIENDIVDRNYAEFIKLPKIQAKEKEIFTDLEIQKLWKNQDIPYVDTILILLYTGMRISELLNLTPFQVDLKNNTITGGNKTDAGKNRIIPIHPKIKPFIVNRYDTKASHLICDEQGKGFTAKRYRDTIFYPILEKLSITKKTPHSTRHTFASKMAQSGANTIAIQKILGHADYSTTANVYTHLDIESLQKAIEFF